MEEEKRDMGHAGRASEGRSLWVAQWNAAWEEAGRAAGSAENLAAGRAAGRKVWSKIVREARDRPPPPASDADWNQQWTPAWNAAWDAAWCEAILAAKATLEDRPDKELAPPRPWDAAGRAARAAAGRAAGCAAWNATYRSEIKK